METAPKKKKGPRKFKLESKEDIQRYLSEVVRSLRRLVVSDPELDPIRINKQKTLVYTLCKLAEVMRDDGVTSLTDEQLRAEVRRRREDELGRGLGVPGEAEQSAETH